MDPVPTELLDAEALGAANEIIVEICQANVEGYTKSSILQHVKFKDAAQVQKLRTSWDNGLLLEKWKKWFTKYHPDVNEETVKVFIDIDVLENIENFLKAG